MENIHLNIAGLGWVKNVYFKIVYMWIQYKKVHEFLNIKLRTIIIYLMDGLRWTIHRLMPRDYKLELDSALLEERKKIARDFHDGFASQLAAIKLNLDMMMLKNENNDSFQELENLRSQLEVCYRDFRWLCHEKFLGDDNFQKPLNEIIEDIVFLANRGKSVRFTFKSEYSFDFPSSIKEQLYFIFKELVANVLKYSQASHCSISMTYFERLGSIYFKVSDNGSGLKSGSGSGMGIKSIQSRALELGGKFSLASSDFGTTAMLLLPVGNKP